MESKVGVYICKGCEIGKCVDVDKLAEVGKSDGKADVVKTHEAMCSRDAVDMIRKDVGEGVNRVVVGACTGRIFSELFDFGPSVLTDRVGLREYVAWTHNPNDEDTQMLAEDYLRMGIAKLKASDPPKPFIDQTSKDIMVVGGGITGMTAAKAAADAGYKVVLVEKEDHLGGWAARYSKIFPHHPPYHDLEDSGHQKLIADVESHPDIKVHKSTVVASTAGQPGLFHTTLQSGEKKTDIVVGAVILASGWKPYPAEKLGHLGYGASPDVITNIQMEEMVLKGDLKRPSDGKGIQSIAFIQCAGSRDAAHLPYCSAVCCRVSLKQALYVKEKYPDARIYIIYKDIRSPAQYELFYAHVQNNAGIFLTKGEIGGVAKENGKIAVNVTQTLLGEDIKIAVDMVVLATGMVPTTRVEDEAATQEAKLTADGKKEAQSAERGAKILNLGYRQGTDLPTLKYGFPDSHFICFPYETRRTAVYAAGSVRAPMDFLSSENDAYGAALKAIQAVEAVGKGAAVHPRAGDLSFPEFYLQRCTQCKRCTEECPFGALDEDEKGTPKPNPFRCRRCGVCMGACPERIVSFANYNVNMISQMIKVIHVPEDWEEKPRILAFVCENDALPALDMVGANRLKYNAMLRVIPLRCLGSINTIWIADALARGFDGVILLGCKKGDDYQCHFVRGSELAFSRMGNVQDKLKQLALEKERVEIHELAIDEWHKIPKIFDNFLEVVNSVGLNPFKGM